MTEPICARAAALETVIWDGEIPETQWNEIWDHSASCAECAAVLNGIVQAKEGVKAMRSDAVAVPDAGEAWNRVEGRLGARGAWHRRVVAGAIAAGIVMTVIGLLENGDFMGGFAGNHTMSPRYKRSVVPAVAEKRVVSAEADSLSPRERAKVGQVDGVIGSLNGALDMYFADRTEHSLGEGVVRLARTGSLSLNVDNTRDAFKQANGLVAAAGGRLVNSRVGQPSAGKPAEAKLTVKIPVAKFDGFISDLHALGEIAAEDLQAEDRTEEYTDLASRSENQAAAMKALRNRLATDKLSSSEVERIRGELNRMQAERDAVETARRKLGEKTDYSTIEITLTEGGKKKGSGMVYFDLFTDNFGSSMELATKFFAWGLSILVIVAGAILPWAIPAGLGWILIRRRIYAW